MNKQIKFTYDGKDYCLEFTKRSVETMENSGFKADDIREKPMTTLPALFAGAFLANHRGIKRSLIDEIYAHMTDKVGLIEVLVQMYNEPIKGLIDDPEESEGNVSWTAI